MAITIDNQWFALSPMILRGDGLQPLSKITLTVSNETETPGGDKAISTVLTADGAGGLVFDISPIVRDVMYRQFVYAVFRGSLTGVLPTGSSLTVSAGGTTLHLKTVWAAKDIAPFAGALVRNSITFLHPSGRFTYHPSPDLRPSVYAQNNITLTIKVRNKATGKETSESITQPAGVNILAYDPSSLTPGEYRLYADGNEAYGIDLSVVPRDTPPNECFYSGRLIRVMYVNAIGGISYADLQTKTDNQKSKASYIRRDTILDEGNDPYNIFYTLPDRIMTGNEVTRTVKAGIDQLTRAEVQELKGIMTSPVVLAMHGMNAEAFPLYPVDGTVSSTHDELQEVTFDFETNEGGF